MLELSPSMKLKISTVKMSKITTTFYGLISILFVVFSFSNGLYFDQSFMTTAVYWSLVGIVFFVWMMLSKIRVSNWLVADYLVFGYFLIYYLSSLWAVNTEYGVLGFVRGLSFLSLYVIIRVLSAKENKTEILLNGLIVSGVLFGLNGLANGFGTLNINGALIVDPSMRRLASNFEYPNTYAIYQAVTFILAVGVTALISSKWKRFIYTISSYTILSSLILTYSRATWVVLAGTLLLFVVLSPKGTRSKIAASILIPTLTVIGTVGWLTKATLNTNPTLGWIVFVVGVLVVIGLVEFYSYAVKRIKEKNIKVVGLVLAVAVFIGLTFGAINNGVAKGLIERLKSINLEQFSVVQRLLFYKDGMKVLSEYPILGAGPNAWPALYQRYQSYPYISRQSHSLLIDTIMNVGILGTLLFLAIIFFVIWTNWRSLKNAETNIRFMQWTILCALLALLVHGAIDFDFSYGTINFLMWTLLALLLPNLSSQKVSASKLNDETTFPKSIVYPGIVLSVVGGVIAGGYLFSNHYLSGATVQNKTPEEALRAAQNATVLAPYRANAWLTRAKYEDLLYKVKNDKDMPSKIKISAEVVVKLAPYDPENLSEAIRYLAKYGDGLITVDIARQAWENGRYKMQYPEQYIVYSNVVGTQLFQKDKSKAKNYFTNSVDTYQDVERRIADFKNLSPVLHLEYGYQITPLMRLNAGEAAYYLGLYEVASQILLPVVTSADEKEMNRAKIMLASIQGKLKKPIDVSVFAVVAKDKQMDQYFTYLNNIEPLK